MLDSRLCQSEEMVLLQNGACLLGRMPVSRSESETGVEPGGTASVQLSGKAVQVKTALGQLADTLKRLPLQYIRVHTLGFKHAQCMHVYIHGVSYMHSVYTCTYIGFHTCTVYVRVYSYMHSVCTCTYIGFQTFIVYVRVHECIQSVCTFTYIGFHTCTVSVRVPSYTHSVCTCTYTGVHSCTLYVRVHTLGFKYAQCM